MRGVIMEPCTACWVQRGGAVLRDRLHRGSVMLDLQEIELASERMVEGIILAGRRMEHELRLKAGPQNDRFFAFNLNYIISFSLVVCVIEKCLF